MFLPLLLACQSEPEPDLEPEDTAPATVFDTTPDPVDTGEPVEDIDGDDEPLLSLSHPHGLYTAPFDLTLTTPVSTAAIRYTLDATDPLSEGGLVYSAPLSIESWHQSSRWTVIPLDWCSLSETGASPPAPPLRAGIL
jgi:hypothetical protein